MQGSFQANTLCLKGNQDKRGLPVCLVGFFLNDDWSKYNFHSDSCEYVALSSFVAIEGNYFYLPSRQKGISPTRKVW